MAIILSECMTRHSNDNACISCKLKAVERCEDPQHKNSAWQHRLPRECHAPVVWTNRTLHFRMLSPNKQEAGPKHALSSQENG